MKSISMLKSVTGCPQEYEDVHARLDHRLDAAEKKDFPVLQNLKKVLKKDF